MIAPHIVIDKKCLVARVVDGYDRVFTQKIDENPLANESRSVFSLGTKFDNVFV